MDQRLQTCLKELESAVAGRERAEFQRDATLEALRIQCDFNIALSLAGELPEVLNRLLEVVFQIKGIDCGGVYLVDEFSGELDLVAHKGLPAGFVEGAAHYDADSPRARLVAAGKPIYQRCSEFPPAMSKDLRREGLCTLAVIPVQYAGRVVAVLNLASHTHDEIPISAREALEAIVAPIGCLVSHVRAGTALRESEEKLRAQYKGIPVPTFTWQRVGKDLVLVDYNDAATAITQGKVADLVGTKARELYQDTPQILEELWQCLAEKTVIEREMLYRYRSTGKSKHLAIKYAFVPPDLVLVHTEDITERVQAKESLKAAHAFQQSIIDGLAEAIIVVDMDYRVKLMNRAAREFLAAGADTSESMLCHQVLYQREAPCKGIEHPCPLGQVRESGQSVTVMHEHSMANGERRFLEVIASPLWGKDGTLQGIIESVRDITERVRAEEALQQYTERLRALAAQMAEVADAERQRLARELHDQVGQNLTALGINLNIVRTQISEETDPAVRSRLDDSLLLVEQTTERIRDVMADLRPPVLDDYGLVAALHWYEKQFARRTDIAIAVEGEEPVPRLAARVENALFHIAQEALTNAAKHAQATQATVTVEVDSGTLRLVIADDGIGFDPSTTLETSPAHLAEPDGGRGWGLLTMTERAEAVGGRCRIESAAGQGTRVVVEVAR